MLKEEIAVAEGANLQFIHPEDVFLGQAQPSSLSEVVLDFGKQGPVNGLDGGEILIPGGIVDQVEVVAVHLHVEAGENGGRVILVRAPSGVGVADSWRLVHTLIRSFL